MTSAKKTPKKSDDRVALTLKVSQRDYERLCLLRAKTRQTAMEILEDALKKALSKAGV